MDKAVFTKMLARRVSKGFNKGESIATLAELVQSHAGDNLASALVYEQFATEKQAYNFVESLNK